MKPNRIVLFVIVAIIAVACTGGSQPTQTDSPDTPGDPVTKPEDGSGDPGLAPEDVPPVPLLSTDNALTEPGTSVTVTGDGRLNGDLALVGPDGDMTTAVMANGSATITVPPQTPPGQYGLRLGDGLAWGSITVTDGRTPSISGPTYVRSDATPEVEVRIPRLGTGMMAALELQSGDGTTQRLIPHPLLDLAPVPVGATGPGIPEGQHRLNLPAGFQGTVRVVADHPEVLADSYPEEDPQLASTSLRIQTCDEPSGISGDLGTAGVVTVRTSSDPTPIRMAVSEGPFSISLNPGMSLVYAIRNDGTTPAASPQLVRVGCGSFTDVADLESPVESGPTAGEYLGGLTSDDLWIYTATATGDLEFTQEGFSDCYASDGVLEVSFGSSSADPWLYTLTLGPPVDTGSYQAALHLDDVFTSESADGTLTGEIEVGKIDGLDAIGGAFAGTIQGSLGTIDIDVAFTCAVYALTGILPTPSTTLMASGMSPSGGLLSGGRYQPLRAALQVGGGISSGDECRKLFINGPVPQEGSGSVEVLMGYWAAMLMPELPRLAIMTAEDIRAMMDAEAARQLFGSEESIDIAGALEAQLLLTLDNVQAGEAWFFSASLYDMESMRKLAGLEATGPSSDAALLAALDRWTEMVEPLAKAGICAEYDPETAVVDVGDTKDFTIRVTDLAGEPPESPEVQEFSSTCGSWDPSSGSVDGDTWHTKFTAGDEACQEKISTTITAQGTAGEVETDAKTSIHVEALWQFDVTIEFKDGDNDLTTHSTGEFFIEPDFDALIGAGTGTAEGSGTARCEVNGAVTWIPSRITGDYQVMVTGQMTEQPENGPLTIQFAPMGFGINSQITYLTSSDCYEAGTYDNDLIGYLSIGVLVSLPHWYNNQPEGFVTYLNPSGSEVTFEESLSGIPGATIRGRLWRPQP